LSGLRHKARGTAADSGAVLVTGASTGIGRALVVDLAGRGVTVFAGVRTTGAAPTGEGLPGRIQEVRLDVTDPAQVAEAAATIRERLAGQRLRAVVNNAGVAVGGPLEFVPVDQMRQQFEVNLFGQLAVTQAVLDLIREHGDGRVVFVGSINGRVATPLVGPYSASKHAVHGLAECLRRELRPWRIQVSVLAPGAVSTPMWDKARDDADELTAQLPTRAVELYGGAMAGLRRYLTAVAPNRSLSTDAVVRTARKALYHRRARATYLIGPQARAGVLLSTVLPARAFDAVLARWTG
jgi:NAD(P)-dependent dehydrogenase (short-subunit alcohol dehydrogenase family)